MLEFYVCAYIRSKDFKTAKAGTPYYIGKGSGYRAWKKSNKHIVTVPTNVKNIVILESNLIEIGAFALDRRYINWHRRKDLGTGILINLTNGGEGSSRSIHSQKSIDKYKTLFSQKIELFGVEYASHSETAKQLTISRKSISRWFSDGKSTYRKEKQTTVNGLTFNSRMDAVKHFSVHDETIRKWMKQK